MTLIDNSAADYDGDGLNEIYFGLADGTAVLHAYMHADGNIQSANYQSKADLTEFMTANGASMNYDKVGQAWTKYPQRGSGICWETQHFLPPIFRFKIVYLYLIRGYFVPT